MPLLMKQARAVIDSRTTVVCLHVSGQIVLVDEPFETLLGFQEAPPFHIHCRTLVIPWMAGFVNEARAEANAELQNRPMKQRRIGPDGPGWRLPPLATTPSAPPPPTLSPEIQAEIDRIARRVAILRKSGVTPAVVDTLEKKWMDDVMSRAGVAPEKGMVPDVVKATKSAEWAKARAGDEYADTFRSVWLGEWDDRHSMAVQRYQSDEWRTINAVKAGRSTDQYAQEVVDVLDRLFAEAEGPAEPGILYRGVRNATGWLDGDMTGKTIVNEGYVSTTFRPEVAKRFTDDDVREPIVMEILVPPGQKVLPVNWGEWQYALEEGDDFVDWRHPSTVLAKHEAEMLLDGGTKFRVVEDIHVDDWHGLPNARVLRVEIV